MTMQTNSATPTVPVMENAAEIREDAAKYRAEDAPLESDSK